jgi:pre-mRNA branch site protein p14
MKFQPQTRPQKPKYSHQRFTAKMALHKEISKVLYVKNLPYKIETDDMYSIFGKYGSLRQIRLGNAHNTRGTAFVVYDDIFDAKTARESLSGFNVGGRYLVVLYYAENRHK